MRQALGRGIDALISKAQNQPENFRGRSVQKIPVDRIFPNRFQPRQVFNEDSLNELAQSIKKHGLAQPVIVIKDPSRDAYELVAGERRLRASKMAGLEDIDAIIRTSIGDEEKLALSLIENLQREDLNAIDLALAYKRLIKEFGISQTEIASYCGKSKSAVSNTLRLLDLDDDIQKSVQTGAITEGHARALLAVPDKGRRERLFHLAIEKKMNVRELEDTAREINSFSGNRKKSSFKKSPEVADSESRLQKLLGTKVDIRCRKKGGTIVIHYYSFEDFDKIVEILGSRSR